MKCEGEKSRRRFLLEERANLRKENKELKEKISKVEEENLL